MGVEGDRFDDFLDRNSNCSARTTLKPDDFCARLSSEFEHSLHGLGVNAGVGREGDALGSCGGENGNHRISVLAKHKGLDVWCRQVEMVSEERPESSGVEHCSKTENLRLGDDSALGRQVGQDVDRVGDDDDGRALSQLAPLQALEDALEESNVPVDEVQAGLIGLSSQTSSDDHTVGAVDDVVRAGRGELDVARERCAMPEVEGFAVGHVWVGVYQGHFSDLSAELERVGRVRSDSSAAADDAYLKSHLACNYGRFGCCA